MLLCQKARREKSKNKQINIYTLEKRRKNVGIIEQEWDDINTKVDEVRIVRIKIKILRIQRKQCVRPAWD